jgi:phospholipid/cholesterol/gamma-HCH transport system ATP-binding protein
LSKTGHISAVSAVIELKNVFWNRLMPTPYVEIAGLDFAYGDRPVLSGVDMKLPKGKLTAIMGGSGCGKTTLLRLIGGQLRPSRGSLRVAGADVGAMTQKALYELRRRMGMLFQFGALFTDLSVYDNVAFPLREHTRLPESAIRDLVLLKLEAVGLRGAAQLMPAELSGGMARRVALARSVALDPELILFDEPFTGLDPISLSIIATLIRRLTDALGATAVMVTHDVHESLAVVDYVYFMSAGRVVGEGTPEDIRVSTDPYVYQFVHAQPDGPVHFHYPAGELDAQLMGCA